MVTRRIRDEAKTWLSGWKGTTFDSSQLPFTHQVIKESMRLLPPVYLFGREAIRTISLGGYSIRKGDSVVMSQWVVHRDPNFFEAPETFRPERWSPDFEDSLPHYAYFPFGGGPRICIGREVAMIEAAVILAALAAEFDLRLESFGDFVPWPTVTLRPSHAIWATVKSCV